MYLQRAVLLLRDLIGVVSALPRLLTILVLQRRLDLILFRAPKAAMLVTSRKMVADAVYHLGWLPSLATDFFLFSGSWNRGVFWTICLCFFRSVREELAPGQAPSTTTWNCWPTSLCYPLRTFLALICMHDPRFARNVAKISASVSPACGA